MDVFSFSEAGLEQAVRLIGRLSEKLMARGLMLGTAESCTGGLIAALCTEFPGSSRWFAGGVIAYGNTVKSGLLAVDPAHLAEQGAVSERVVRAMAIGALDALGVDLGLAVSGIAGPDGGSVDKPVGTVWTGAAFRPHAGRVEPGNTPAVELLTQRHLFSGNRGEVRLSAVLAVVEQALAFLVKTAN